MDWHIVWVWLTFFLVSCSIIDDVIAFNEQGMEGSQGRADWMQQSELINSVPRIGRRSFSPIAKYRGEGFRFYGGDLPRSGVARGELYGFPDSKDAGNPVSKSAKNWRGFWEPAFGGGLQENVEESTADIEEDKTSGKDQNQKSRDKRVEEYLNPEKRRGLAGVVDGLPSGPAPSAFTLGDDEYWNEFLNGARKSVLDKLSKMSLLSDAEEVVEEVAQDVDSVPSGPALNRFLSRYPIENKTNPKSKPQLTRSEILSNMNGFRGFARNNL